MGLNGTRNIAKWKSEQDYYFERRIHSGRLQDRLRWKFCNKETGNEHPTKNIKILVTLTKHSQPIHYRFKTVNFHVLELLEKNVQITCEHPQHRTPFECDYSTIDLSFGQKLFLWMVTPHAFKCNMLCDKNQRLLKIITVSDSPSHVIPRIYDFFTFLFLCLHGIIKRSSDMTELKLQNRS